MTTIAAKNLTAGNVIVEFGAEWPVTAVKPAPVTTHTHVELTMGAHTAYLNDTLVTIK